MITYIFFFESAHPKKIKELFEITDIYNVQKSVFIK